MSFFYLKKPQTFLTGFCSSVGSLTEFYLLIIIIIFFIVRNRRTAVCFFLTSERFAWKALGMPLPEHLMTKTWCGKPRYRSMQKASHDSGVWTKRMPERLVTNRTADRNSAWQHFHTEINCQECVGEGKEASAYLLPSLNQHAITRLERTSRWIMGALRERVT